MRGSRNICQGWGVQVNLTKKSSDNVFFFLSSAHFTEVKWSISKKSIIFQGFRGVQHFPGGSNFFQGGFNCLFPIETHITFDFPGGVRTPCPPSGSALEQTAQMFGYCYNKYECWSGASVSDMHACRSKLNRHDC